MSQFNYEVSYPHVVGEYLRRELKVRHITQEAFSLDFGADVRTVRRWIKDGVNSLDTVVEIARYFGVSVGDVLSLDNDIPLFFYSKYNKKFRLILMSVGFFAFNRAFPVLLNSTPVRYNCPMINNDTEVFTMKKIVGYEKEKNEIANLQNMLLNSELYRNHGIRIPRGLVLFGEPGVGKTQLAKSIAAEGITMVELRAASCCDSNARKALEEVFCTAKQNQPSVILLDELDKIAGTPEMILLEDNSEVQKMLLQLLDTLTDDDCVLVIATCNDTEILGDALLRPGRFDRKIHVETPDSATRKKILEEYFGRFHIEIDLDFDYVAKLIPGYSGAKIECLANEVGIVAIEKRQTKITLANVLEAMNKLTFYGSEKEPLKTKEEMRKIAVHEAGHAVVALALCPENLYGASILPQGNSNGHICFVNSDTTVRTAKNVENEVTVLLAGHVAEKAVLGEYLLGSDSDLSAAEAKLRFLTYSQGVYGYRCIVGISAKRYDPRIDDATQAVGCKIIEDKFCEFDKKARAIIIGNRMMFDRIVEELIEKQTLTREDLLKIYNDFNTAMTA